MAVVAATAASVSDRAIRPPVTRGTRQATLRLSSKRMPAPVLLLNCLTQEVGLAGRFIVEERCCDRCDSPACTVEGRSWSEGQALLSVV